MPETIDPVFAKTSSKRSFSMTEYERFGLVFTKTRVYKFGHWGGEQGIHDPGCVYIILSGIFILIQGFLSEIVDSEY